MRPHGQTKLGFFPLPIAEAERLKHWLNFPDEFSALDTLLRILPLCLNPNGRVAILTFHSGEDRRVKKSFEAGLREGFYLKIAPKIIRPTARERNSNPRSVSAKLRWARRTA